MREQFMDEKNQKSGDYKIKFQEELGQIHAPKDLIEKTKLAMKQAEKENVRGNEQENEAVQNIGEGKELQESRKAPASGSYGRWIGVAAAAVVLLAAVICSDVFFSGDGDIGKDTPIQLGTEESKGPSHIGNEEDGTKFNELVINKTDKTRDEVLGKDLEELVIADVPVVISVNVISGYYQCFYEDGVEKYLITSKMTEKEAFIEEVCKYLGR